MFHSKCVVTGLYTIYTCTSISILSGQQEENLRMLQRQKLEKKSVNKSALFSEWFLF